MLYIYAYTGSGGCIAYLAIPIHFNSSCTEQGNLMPLSQACRKAAMKGSNIEGGGRFVFLMIPRGKVCELASIYRSSREEGTWKTRCVVQVILVSSRCLSQLWILANQVPTP